MKLFYTDQVECKGGEIIKLNGKDTLITGTPGETYHVGGQLWAVESVDWWDAQEIKIALIEADLAELMSTKFDAKMLEAGHE